VPHRRPQALLTELPKPSRGAGGGEELEDAAAAEVLAQQTFQRRMDVQQRGVQPIGESSRLGSQVGVIAASTPSAVTVCSSGSTRRSACGRVRAASAMTNASRASVLPSPGYRSAIRRIANPGR
jgi:hypothetical protein